MRARMKFSKGIQQLVMSLLNDTPNVTMISLSSHEWMGPIINNI
jgi:hypothetical protein